MHIKFITLNLILLYQNDANAPSHPHVVNGNVIYQTRPLCSIAPWSSYDAQVPIFGTFGSGLGSVWAP